MATGTKTICLALQGGGAHGAFTWGVLDRFLEEEDIDFEGISGTSAGAMNAIMLAHGLMDGGREGARQLLDEFWGKVASEVPFPIWLENFFDTLPDLYHEPPLWMHAYLNMLRFLSPYQVNPFDLNPLEIIVKGLVDFRRLRKHCPIRLFINATQVRTGKIRVFTTEEMRLEMLLASACLPNLHKSVKINHEEYWDGGFTGNPAIFPLIYECKKEDILVVILHPLKIRAAPVSIEDISERMAELGFSTAFLREMRAITLTREQIDQGLLRGGRLIGRFKKLRFHIIEAERLMVRLSDSSKYDVRKSFLNMLKKEGRQYAGTWLKKHKKNIGKQSSVNLGKLFT